MAVKLKAISVCQYESGGKVKTANPNEAFSLENTEAAIRYLDNGHADLFLEEKAEEKK